MKGFHCVRAIAFFQVFLGIFLLSYNLIVEGNISKYYNNTNNLQFIENCLFF